MRVHVGSQRRQVADVELASPEAREGEEAWSPAHARRSAGPVEEAYFAFRRAYLYVIVYLLSILYR
jgi:hypothetical protein